MTEKISVLGASQRAHVFGSFEWSERKGGSIRIDPRWVERNIVSCRLAKANGKSGDVVTSCHRLAKEPLEAAFGELADSGQWRLIDTFDGLWVPRHMTWNPKRGLSSHSWGIAFDLNAARNPYNGGTSAANRTLNETFNRHGFAWGGDWNGAKDSMHWELADLDQAQAALQAPVVPAEPRLIVAVEREQGLELSLHSRRSSARRSFLGGGVPYRAGSGSGSRRGAARGSSAGAAECDATRLGRDD